MGSERAVRGRIADAIVIGAGVAGLAATDSLLSAGRSVCLLEAGSRPGGLARSLEVGGETIEAYYHHAFPQDRETRDLVRRLGLSDRLEWRRAATGVLHRGRLYPFDSAVDLLRFGALRPFSRIRLGLGAGVAMLAGRRRSIAGARVADSGPRWFGRPGYEVLWRPLLEGKFGPSAPDVSMAWLAARLRQRAQARKSGTGDRLGYLRGGFGVLAEALARDVVARGVDLAVEARVESITRQDERWIVRTGTGDYSGRAVVACLSPAALGRLVDLPGAYATRASAIEFRGVVCVLLELDRALSDFYWINLAESSPFATLAVIEHTNFIPPERYGGRHLVYLAHYVEFDGPVWKATLDEILDAIEPTFRAINPSFRRDWVVGSHVTRDRWAQPIPLAGGPMVGLPMATGLPGLFNASIAHIFPDDRGISLSLRMGQHAGAMADEWLSR